MQAKIISLSTVALLSAFTTACSAPLPGGIKSQSASSVQANGSALMGKISMSVTSASTGAMIYSDAVSNSTLQLTAGQAYSLDLSIANPQPGASYQLESTQTNIATSSATIIPLNLGSNSLVVPGNGQGDYSWKFVISAPNMSAVTKFYIATVQCSSPTFTGASLNAAGISVSAGAGSNMYNFSAGGVIAGANGLAPYTCAWDPTGTGVQDSAFGSCTAAVSAYVNYVGTRNVGLLVKDACSTVHSVSRVSALAYSTPAMPGNVFITGHLTNATGSAIGDSRVDGVDYLATNSGGNNIVQPSYGGGTFRIEALQNYQMPSSVKFGMQITLKGLTDSINVRSGTGSISAAGASIAKIVYSTDQSGDLAPPVSLSGSSCTLTNQGARVLFVSGQPCSAGTTGSNNKATVEVWGHYQCGSIATAGATTAIQGDFDGYTDIVDNCSGGGGGGGGIVPITL